MSCVISDGIKRDQRVVGCSSKGSSDTLIKPLPGP